MGALSKQIQPTPLQRADEIMLFLCFKLCYLESKLSGTSSDKILHKIRCYCIFAKFELFRLNFLGQTSVLGSFFFY